MKRYECAVIFAPTVGSDVLENSTKKYAEIITSRGGSLAELDNWGKRTLAYEIQYHREGYYYFYRFQAKNDVLEELNRQLRIDENVIRHMIVRDDPKPVRVRKAIEEPTEPEEEDSVDEKEDE